MIKNKVSLPNRVLIEHFDAKFDLVLDGYAMTNKKIDDLRDTMNERFDAVDESFAAIDDKFEAVFDVLDDIKHEMKSVKI